MLHSFFTYNQIVPLLICFILTASSIITFQFKKNTISLFLLFFSSLAIGYFIANLDSFLIIWDEQYHALVAKNLLYNPLKPVLYSVPVLDYDYTSWTSNYVWLHKQPLFLWQIALSLKLFGYNAMAVRLPSIILHAFISIFIFRIGKISHSTNVGYYSALFFTMAYYPLELVAGRYSTDHNDVAFLCYVTASFWAWFEYYDSKNKYWIILIGLFSGLAVLVKWLVGLLIFAIWFIVIVYQNKQKLVNYKLYLPFSISVLISLLVFLPWQLFIINQYPLESKFEYQLNSSHFFCAVENHSGSNWFHFAAISELYGSGFLIPIIILIGLYLYLKKITQKIYGICVVSALSITYLFFTIAATKMLSFCLIVSPFIFISFGCFINEIVEFIQSKIKKSHVVFTFIILMVVSIMFLNFNKIKNNHTFWKPKDNKNRKIELDEMAFINQLKKEMPNKKCVLFYKTNRININIPIMFFTNAIAYDFIPTLNQTKKVMEQGYTVVVVNNVSLPEFILKNKAIKKINKQQSL